MRSQLDGEPEGLRWFEAQLAAASTVLGELGLPTHVEGELAPGARSRAMLDSFPYSFLHFLRHAYAWARQRAGEPLPELERLGRAEQARIEDEIGMLDSHLILHSDCDGLYVPVDFGAPIHDPRLAGETLGSTQRLEAELTLIAPLLGVELVSGEVSDEAMAALDVEDDDPLHREKLVFATLWEACRLSLAHRCAIVFH
ncbi:MAG TPA: hypothetical protein PK095_20070 [Myxococcota bacterium]|nr:hypothetical protein [Myxococcota bacterium]